jgi:hypothetical protein
MVTLIGEEQQNKNNNFYKIFRDKKELENIKENNQVFFQAPDIHKKDQISFEENPTYKIEPEQWFYISFDKCSDAINQKLNEYREVFLSSAEINNLTKEKLNKLTFIIYRGNVENTCFLNMQHIKPSSYIKSKKYVKVIEGNPKYEHSENVLEFKDKCDIHINYHTKKIFFKRIEQLKKVHPNFNSFYKEATEQDVEIFLKKINCHKISFNIKINYKNVGIRNRKQIKDALDRGQLDSILKNPKKICAYLEKFKFNLSTDDNGEYVIEKNKDVTEFLKIIN